MTTVTVDSPRIIDARRAARERTPEVENSQQKERNRKWEINEDTEKAVIVLSRSET